MEPLNKIIMIGIFISLIGCQSQQSDKINDHYLIESEKETSIGEPTILTANDIMRFDSLFLAWKYTYRTDMQMRISSNTNDAKKLEQYPLLLGMGKKIIPLVVERLLEPDDFFVLTLYDDLQDVDSLKCLDYYSSLQDRVQITLEKYRSVQFTNRCE